MEDETPRNSAPAGLYLIHDAGLGSEIIEQLSELADVNFVSWAERNSPPPLARVLLYLGDEAIRDLALHALEQQWGVGILPHPEAAKAMAALGVKGEMSAVFDYYRSAPVIGADALTCNGELVFSSVVIGRVLALRPRDINRPQTPWSTLTGALKGLSKLRLSPYKITTGKERVIHLAALGMVALGQTQSALVERAFSEELGIADGRVALVVLAPRSILSYLWFLLRLLWPQKISLTQLPASLSLVRTDRLHITAPEGAEYIIDGKPVHAAEIELQVQEGRLRLLPGPALLLGHEGQKVVDKETVRLNHTPVEEGARALADVHLPLFSHATEEEYRELFISLRDNAKATHSFQVLMILSVLLALAGLYANSAPVIIGAMILAPLMLPIVSLAMGLARTESNLIRTSMRTLVIGILWGLGCAVFVAWAMPLDVPTAEMTARMSPTLMDLFVAVISGVAGAYAYAKEEVAKSLAGVAIAVALVPPLSVAGVGLGWGDWDMAGGALLLLITNLVGIALAASATFLVLGFAPFRRARAGIGISLLIMLLISAPLTLSFYSLVQKDRMLEHLPTGEIKLSDVTVNISRVDVALNQQPHLVRLVLSANRLLKTSDVEELKGIVSERVGEPVLLEVQSNIRR
ncbi:MAG: TIGR00341 family protein [Halioglobus sp.]|nr:TIGR00341 family protein [Halioglobus sp.]